MLFFIICAAFALFPEKVIDGAAAGVALCINSVIPSLLPFMLISSCMIKSNFSRPLGYIMSKFLTPLTGLSKSGCVCLFTGLIGGYGAGAKAVFDSYREGQISKAEGESLLAFCNNAGPLFIIGTVGISFFGNSAIGAMLFLIQILSTLTCAALFSFNTQEPKTKLSEEISFYKKNKPSPGRLISECAVSSGSGILTVCVFVITFSAIINLLPIENHPFIAGIIEVTCGVRNLSRFGSTALPAVSALLSWGGLSVHFQASALCGDVFSMKKCYIGKITGSLLSGVLTYIACTDIYITLLLITIIFVLLISSGIIRAYIKSLRQHVYRQQQRS